MLNLMYTANLNEQQRMWFYAEFQQAAKGEMAGVLLSLFLGTFGIHRLYLGETVWCTLYALFFWTGIPSILGFIECFLMPGRVREYNSALAQSIAAGILASAPTASISYQTQPPFAALARKCAACGSPVMGDSAFCPSCNALTAQAS